MTYDLVVSLAGEMITRQVSNVVTKSIDPGGYASVTLDLARPINAESLDPFTQVEIFDAATGEQVGGGRVLDPGPSANESGEVWSLSAVGEGVAHMDDIEAPYILIDTSQVPWHQSYSTSKKMTWTQADQPADGSTDGLLFDIDDGATINPTWKCDLRYFPIYDAGQLVGGYSYTHLDGRNSANDRLQDFASTRFGTYDIPNDTGFTASGVYIDAEVGVDFAVIDARDNVFIRFTRASTTLTAAADDWAHVEGIRISAMRLGRDRQPVVGPGAYTNNYILAHEAVIDLWARFCPRFDLVNADIDLGTFQFDQLAWLSGIKPSGVMDEILSAEGGFTWHVWERQPNGKWRAEFVQRPTDVRYELTAFDGFRASDGSSDLIDIAYVTGTDKLGRQRVTKVTGFQQALSDAGFHRARIIDLGSDLWSTATAQQVGAQAITDSAMKSTSAQVTIGRKVLDLYTGRHVKPFHILPGHLCRVRGVKPTQDTLNPDGVSDGSSVFRIVSNTYSSESASSVLELNAYTVSESRAIADLVRARSRR